MNLALFSPVGFCLPFQHYLEQHPQILVVPVPRYGPEAVLYLSPDVPSPDQASQLGGDIGGVQQGQHLQEVELERAVLEKKNVR